MANRSWRRLVGGPASAAGILLSVLIYGCATSQRSVDEATRVSRLASEVERMRGEVLRLSQRLEVERKLQHDERVALESVCAVRDVAAAVTSTSIEAELRNTQRALVRIVERLDLSPEAKRELVMAARPARQLDDANPWVAAK